MNNVVYKVNKRNNKVCQWTSILSDKHLRHVRCHFVNFIAFGDIFTAKMTFITLSLASVYILFLSFSQFVVYFHFNATLSRCIDSCSHRVLVGTYWLHKIWVLFLTRCCSFHVKADANDGHDNCFCKIYTREIEPLQGEQEI